MKLYIDKENILTFMKEREYDIDLFEESIRLIKRGMAVHYNFPKDDIKNEPILMAWFGRMKGTGVRFPSFFCPDATIKPERPLKSNFYLHYDLEDRGSLFLLNIEENTHKIIHDKWSILIGKPGDEFSIFKSLLDIPNRPRLMIEIKSWFEYRPLIPLTDVIICDNHYFKNSNVYKKNDNELIRALASVPKDVFNVVIFTKEGEIDRAINLDEEAEGIKNIIASTSSLSKKKCAVTIITTNRIHSRHIITNYYRISPTSCVHLKNNGLKRDVNIIIESHTDPEVVDYTKKLVREFQEIAKNPVKIFGDRRSNFLSFT